MKQLTTGDIFIFGDFRLELAIGRLDRRDEGGVFQRVVIGERAIEVLGVLVERAGQVVSKQDIMAAIWSNTAVEGNLTVQIAALRRILDDPQTGASCIRTVFRRGYCLAMAVTRVQLRPEPPPAIQVPPGQPSPQVSITVLPLVSLSDDSDLRWLAQRITEHITAKLSRLPAVQAMACEEKSMDGQQGNKQVPHRLQPRRVPMAPERLHSGECAPDRD
jgi:DNA-binding winged helix-turn-helix (wHTH) protein